jgi:hypothetical protein
LRVAKRLGKMGQTDTLDLKPDVWSILIGVNDIRCSLRDHQPVPSQKYEWIYDQLLAETIAALPQGKLILWEPFIAKGRTRR